MNYPHERVTVAQEIARAKWDIIRHRSEALSRTLREVGRELAKRTEDSDQDLPVSSLHNALIEMQELAGVLRSEHVIDKNDERAWKAPELAYGDTYLDGLGGMSRDATMGAATRLQEYPEDTGLRLAEEAMELDARQAALEPTLVVRLARSILQVPNGRMPLDTVALVTDITKSALERNIRKGAFPGHVIKDGGRRMWASEDIRAFLAGTWVENSIPVPSNVVPLRGA